MLIILVMHSFFRGFADEPDDKGADKAGNTTHGSNRATQGRKPLTDSPKLSSSDRSIKPEGPVLIIGLKKDREWDDYQDKRAIPKLQYLIELLRSNPSLQIYLVTSLSPQDLFKNFPELKTPRLVMKYTKHDSRYGIAQDQFETVYDKNGKPVILDLSLSPQHEESAERDALLHLAFPNIRIKSAPKEWWDRPVGEVNQVDIRGGNSIGFPDGNTIVGEKYSALAKKGIAEITGKSVHTFTENRLDVGHLDEVFAYLKNPDVSSNGVLLIPDFEKGLELWEEYLSNTKTLSPEMQRIKALTVGSPERIKEVKVFQKRLTEEVEGLQKKLPNTLKGEIKKVPVFAWPDDKLQFGSLKGFSTFGTENAVNAIVLGKNVYCFKPAAFLEESVKAAYEELGYKVTFINRKNATDSFYVPAGGIHCSSFLYDPP